MTFALFQADGSRVIPLPASEGPWMPGALSGSAVGPLIAALSERIAPPSPMLTTRISIEFLRPVPMKPLDVTAEILREGRKQQVLRLSLSADGKQAISATILRLRTENLASSDDVETSEAADFDPPQGVPFAPELGGESAVLDWVDSRVLASNGPGVAEAWLRYRGCILEGQPLTPLMRAALFADFGNGLAPVVDPRHFTYMNADLSFHIARLPRGEWIHLKVRTIDGGNGLAEVGTELGDAEGRVGWAHQSLLLERRADSFSIPPPPLLNL